MTEPNTPLALWRGKPPRVCLDCRTVLHRDKRCDSKQHRVVALATTKGRAAWLEALWGPPDARARAKELAKASGSGAGFGLLLELGECVPDVGAAAVMAVMAVIGLLVGAAWWFVTKIEALYRAYRDRLLPNGPAKKVAKLRGARRGTVVGGPSILAPGSGEPCLGYGVELLAKGRLKMRTVLREGQTGGFSIELDDGDRVEVPAGRIRIRGPTARHDPSDVIEDMLRPIRERFPADELEPLPVDEVAETLLLDGDEVILRGDLQEAAVGAEEDASATGPYRGRLIRRFTVSGAAQVEVRTRVARH
jgi:hypothetical protein